MSTAVCARAEFHGFCARDLSFGIPPRFNCRASFALVPFFSPIMLIIARMGLAWRRRRGNVGAPAAPPKSQAVRFFNKPGGGEKECESVSRARAEGKNRDFQSRDAKPRGCVNTI